MMPMFHGTRYPNFSMSEEILMHKKAVVLEKIMDANDRPAQGKPAPS